MHRACLVVLGKSASGGLSRIFLYICIRFITFICVCLFFCVCSILYMRVLILYMGFEHVVFVFADIICVF